MDDWNRARKSTEINCPRCSENRRVELKAERDRQSKRQELFELARILASQRYLEDWLASFSGLSRKDAWKKHTGGSGYPALGTFYLHVRQAGSLPNYLKSCFDLQFPEVLEKLGIRDADIAAILKEYAQTKVESPGDRLPL
jgi:hypothetical protein